jgi:hypothetical protein
MGHRPNLGARPPSPTTTDARRRSRGAAAALGVAVALAMLVIPTALANAGAVGSAPPSRLTPAVTVPGPGESWAWGALANVSASVQYFGVYNHSLNLTGGSWTPSGSGIALNESFGLQYAAYAVLNATSPNASNRFVELQAAELRAEHVSLAARGTFPLAGNYSANATIPLAPTNFSVALSEEVLDVVHAFLNFSTGANGSLALENEHLAFLEGVNLSLDAHQFPNVTQGAGGSVSIRYVSGAISLGAWRYENVSASFSPALALVEGPLSVGKNWTATSNATFAGSVAWAEAIHARSPTGGTASAGTAGEVAVQTSAPVSLACADVGTTTVRMPDGTVENDSDIACTNATGSPTYLATDGLIVLPSSDPSGSAGVDQAVPEQPASAPAAPANAVRSSTLYSPSRQFVDSTRSTPQPGDSVTASPMSPDAATSAMHALGAPAPPSASPSHSGAGAIVVIALAIAGVVAVSAVAISEVRARRRQY